jgi:4-hydroxy-tetrahydrodipicolinate reductase
MAIKVSVLGATGRMGRLALELIDGAPDLELHSALSSRSQLDEMVGADVVFDVTRLEISEQAVAKALELGISIVVGTSGWNAERLDALGSRDISKSSVVIIPNFSIGSMLATQFAALAARHFDSIEIVETHHAGKLDSPSGTAVRTAEQIAAARANDVHAASSGQQARGQLVAGIPVHSLRLDGVSAKQEVQFGAKSEVLTITHETSSVHAYSVGVLACLRFAAQSKGLFVGLDAVVR